MSKDSAAPTNTPGMSIASIQALHNGSSGGGAAAAPAGPAGEELHKVVGVNAGTTVKESLEMGGASPFAMVGVASLGQAGAIFKDVNMGQSLAPSTIPGLKLTDKVAGIAGPRG